MKVFANHIAVALIVFLSVQSVFSESGPDKVVRYARYGAVGDGVADDFDAIVKAHAAANEAGLKVCADAGATYYIGGGDMTAVIRTDTDWGDAKFLIDDTNVVNRHRHVFSVRSELPSSKITTVKTLRKNQAKLDLSLPQDSFVIVTDGKTLRYKRYGRNQNRGAAQTDVFVVDKNGNVHEKNPIQWDYDTITSMTVYPIDPETLTVRGGHFTTVANRSDKSQGYFSRGIGVARSRVVIDGVRHGITGELDKGAPYGGFISVTNCSDVTVRNCVLSGHLYTDIGTYDLLVTRAANVTFENCTQTNDIHDRKYWGIFGSNFSKNITFDTVEFSRFDAHMGVVNATIRNSTLGHQGINLIGGGVFLIENSKVCSASFINLRSDYGSTFEGEIVIRDCEFIPRNGAKSDAVLIGGANSGQHDFGYACCMPKKIAIDGLVIRDDNPVNNYPGPKIFGPFNNARTSDAYVEKYPFKVTEEVEIGNLTIRSGKPYLVSNNPFLFRNVRITEKKK